MSKKKDGVFLALAFSPVILICIFLMLFMDRLLEELSAQRQEQIKVIPITKENIEIEYMKMLKEIEPNNTVEDKKTLKRLEKIYGMSDP